MTYEQTIEQNEMIRHALEDYLVILEAESLSDIETTETEESYAEICA